MRLLDLLPLERIVVPLEAPTIRAGTRALAQVLIDGGAVTAPRRLEQLLEDAWPEDIAAVGSEVMLPHFRTDAVRRIGVALGIARQPICREEDPKRCARIIVLIVSPPSQAATYLQVLSAFARLLSQPDVVRLLLTATDPEAVRRVDAMASVELPGRIQVRDVMTAPVLSVTPETPIAEAARLMASRDIRALPVVDDAGGVVGLVGDQALLRHLIPAFLQRESGEFALTAKAIAAAERNEAVAIPVRDVMERSVLCLSEDQTLADVANLMGNKERDRYPVVRDGILVGFLTRADVLRRLFTLIL